MIEDPGKLRYANSGYHCEVCGQPVPCTVQISYCCNGNGCGCYGLPPDPVCCSEECDKIAYEHADGHASFMRSGRAGCKWEVCSDCGGSKYEFEANESCEYCGGMGRLNSETEDYGGWGPTDMDCYCINKDVPCTACDGTGAIYTSGPVRQKFNLLHKAPISTPVKPNTYILLGEAGVPVDMPEYRDNFRNWSDDYETIVKDPQEADDDPESEYHYYLYSARRQLISQRLMAKLCEALQAGLLPPETIVRALRLVWNDPTKQRVVDAVQWLVMKDQRYWKPQRQVGPDVGYAWCQLILGWLEEHEKQTHSHPDRAVYRSLEGFKLPKEEVWSAVARSRKEYDPR